MWLHLISIKEKLPQLLCLVKLLEAKNLVNVISQPRMVLLGLMDIPQDLFWPFPHHVFQPVTRETFWKLWHRFFSNFIHCTASIQFYPKLHWEHHHTAKISRDRDSAPRWVAEEVMGLGIHGSLHWEWHCTAAPSHCQGARIHPGSLDLGAHNTHIAQMPKIFHQKLLHWGAQLLRLNYFF